MAAHRFVAPMSVLLFLGLAAWPAAVYAQDDSTSVTASAVRKLQLTQAQLEAFAELVGDSPVAVSQRLANAPSLVPFAIAAAEVRRERKSSGKVMTAAGFSILVVGTVGGLVLAIVSAPCSSNASGDAQVDCSSHTMCAVVGLSVALLSQGVGLALGIPGIVRLAKESDVETEAAERYVLVATDRVNAPADSGLARSRLAAMGLMLPLLSAVF